MLRKVGRPPQTLSLLFRQDSEWLGGDFYVDVCIVSPKKFERLAKSRFGRN
jgi:hypothetical protein